MVEFSKFMKIVLIINIIAAFVYGIFYLFIPEIYANLVEASDYNDQFYRLWGGTCVSLGIFGILGLLRNDWDRFKMLFEFVILWLIITEIINFASFAYIVRTPANLASEWIDVIVIILIIKY
jgi:hypothetical protein